MVVPAPRQTDGLEVFVVEDGYVVHDDATGRVHHLNLTSALVFELCDGSTDPAEIAVQVAEAFDLADPAAVDIEACIAELTAQGVLVVSEEAASDLSGVGSGLAVIPSSWDARYLRRLPRPRTVIDVGVAAGTPSLYDAFPDARLVLVEPLAEWEPDLRRIVAARPGSVYALAAAGSVPGTVVVNVEPRLTERSSTFAREPYESTGDATTEREVPVVTLDSLLEDHEVDGPIGLKIDTEGWELEVLLGAPTVLERTVWVIAEVSLDRRFAGRTSVAQLISLLDERGFEVVDVLDVGRSEHTGDATFLDLVFARPLPRSDG